MLQSLHNPLILINPDSQIVQFSDPVHYEQLTAHLLQLILS